MSSQELGSLGPNAIQVIGLAIANLVEHRETAQLFRKQRYELWSTARSTSRTDPPRWRERERRRESRPDQSRGISHPTHASPHSRPVRPIPRPKTGSPTSRR